MRTVLAFLLAREWRDADDGVEITLWARTQQGPVRIRLTRQEGVMFVLRSATSSSGRRVPRALSTMQGDAVDALYFRSQRSLVEERERAREDGRAVFESDVKPSDRYLMERFVTGGLHVEGPARERSGVLFFDNPKVRTADVRIGLTHLALDLETDGFDGPLLSAAIASPSVARVIVRGDPPADWHGPAHVTFAANERTLLQQLFAEIVRLDPDVICGWNVTEFDLTVLDTRARALGVPFSIGRGGERARVLPGSTAQRLSIAKVPGRVVLDGVATLKSATYSFERLTLEHVARELLGRGKTIAEGVDKMEEIRRMYREDVALLAEYNLEDCRLVLDIFAKADLIGFAMERQRMTGLAMDRPGGSVAAFDHLYLPRLHRRGFVAADVGESAEVESSPGGYVLESTPGLYDDVLSFDFRSLYPSIIRTFQIDPLGLAQPGDDPVPGEDGAAFARENAILPALITTLHEARSAAMASDNAALSRAIKILMNSFYGVLGTPGCRFFDPRLPTSITRRGHSIITRAKAFFEDQGLPVIYGDTDSLFVHFEGRASIERGREIATEITKTIADEIAHSHRLESFLELRFESHYEKFLMPTTRGSERGSKKRYAGASRSADGKTKIVVKGLEAVRRDWTPLARRVQLELLRRVFTGEPYTDWLLGIVADLRAGTLDHEIGEKRDYATYIDKQLAPVCDVVLPFLGTSFDRIAGTQTSLF